jgi:23S rRNA pseudouridine2605 synthase
MTAKGSRPPVRPDRGEGSSDPGTTGRERLQKTLARAGYGSRRGVEELITAGRVRIGERIAQLGDRVDPLADQVFVDDAPVAAHPGLRYFALNKPAGVTTTLRDAHAERSVAALLPPGPRLFPVGRLDRDSEGLLLLTNDGDLAHRLQHPRYGVEREYLAEVEGVIPRAAVRQLTRGVALDDGPARAIRASIVESGRARTALSVVMAEGRKREVRRMVRAVGFPVKRLVRTRVGPVRLGSLKPGATRALTPEEIAELYRLTGLRRATPTSG